MMPSKFQKGAKPKPTVTVAEFRLGGKPKPAEDDQDDEGEAMDVSAEAELSAFRSLRKALAAQDDEKGVSALKAFLEACGAYEGEPDADDGEEE